MSAEPTPLSLTRAERVSALPAVPARPRLLDRPLTSYHLILGSTLLIAAFGLVMVLSASSVTSYQAHQSPYGYFQRQATWAVAGLVILALAMRVPERWWRRGAWLALAVALGLLALAFVPRFDVTINGATRWIRLGPVQLQPSEFAKLALALWGAHVLASKERVLARWRHLLVPLLPVALLLVGLVMHGSDLGTTIVLLTITASLLWVAGTPVRLFVLLSGALLGLGVLLVATEPYRLERITAFVSGGSSTRANWQPTQGLLALGSGGWFGVGLGASRQKWSYVPNQNTDYIFAIIGEELGLIGTLTLLGLFAILVYGGLRVAMRTPDLFGRLAAGAVTAWIGIQALVNMGAVVRLLPITGIPLPLVSYGGSALLPTLLGIALLLMLARREPGAPQVLASRRAARRDEGWARATWRSAGRRVRRPGARPRPRPAGPGSSGRRRRARH